MTIDFGLRPVADISLEKFVSNSTPLSGETVTFTITVTNDGPSPITNAEITDFLPSGYSNPTNVSNGGAVAGSTITWAGLDLPFPGSIDLTFDVTVNSPSAGGDYNNIAEVTAMDQVDFDSEEGNGADTDGDGEIGPSDNDGSQDADDEDDGDDECVLVIECPADEVVECISDWTPSDVVFNSCCEVTVTNSTPVLVSGSADCDGAVYEVVYTVADCFRSTTCTQTMIISNVGPSITCAADEVVECAADISETAPTVVVACALESDVATLGPT